MNGKRFLSCFFALAIFAAFAGNSHAAEKIDDPRYTYWSKFKPGSFQTVETRTDASGQKMLVLITTTLLDVTPEKLTVEVKTETTAGTKKLPTRTKKTEVLAKRDKPADSSFKESKEDVKVGAKTYSCLLMEETTGDMHIKSWMSDQVPGGVVKMEMNSDGLAIESHLVESGVK
jgi:hypothetical protein